MLSAVLYYIIRFSLILFTPLCGLMIAHWFFFIIILALATFCMRSTKNLIVTDLYSNSFMVFVSRYGNVVQRRSGAKTIKEQPCRRWRSTATTTSVLWTDNHKTRQKWNEPHYQIVSLIPEQNMLVELKDADNREISSSLKPITSRKIF